MTPDLQKARREHIRWLILQALNSARPVGTSEEILHSALMPVVPDLTHRELRCELDYLEERTLILITGRSTQPEWFCKIDRFGIDVVEYTVDCDAGIARPNKYW
jgi:hypothetical protein